MTAKKMNSNQRPRKMYLVLKELMLCDLKVEEVIF